MGKDFIGGSVQKVVIVDPWNDSLQDSSLQISNRRLDIQISDQPVTVTAPEDETPNVFTSVAGVTVTNEATLWTPGDGKRFKLLGGLLSYLTTAAIVELIDGTGGVTFFTLPQVAVNTPFSFYIPGGYTSTAANNPLRADGGSLQVLTGTIWGREV